MVKQPQDTSSCLDAVANLVSDDSSSSSYSSQDQSSMACSLDEVETIMSDSPTGELSQDVHISNLPSSTTATPPSLALRNDMDSFNSLPDDHSTDDSRTAALNNGSPLSQCSRHWSNAVLTLHRAFLTVLKPMVKAAVTFPRLTVSVIATLSIVLLIMGYNSNFILVVDEGTLWTPIGSKSTANLEYNHKAFHRKSPPYSVTMLFHANGKNILGMEQMQTVFDVLQTIGETPDYDNICQEGPELMDDLTTGCSVYGVTKYFDTNVQTFQQQVSSDQDVRDALSKTSFPDGTPTTTESLMGHAVKNNSTHRLESALSFNIYFRHPRYENGKQSRAWGKQLTESLLFDHPTQWRMADGSLLELEIVHQTSFADEFLRSILADIPLVPFIFLVMSVFTCCMFWKYHKIRSRTLLGFSAVLAVLLSISAAYGIAFIRAVPFTTITNLLPFVLFGIGLDDAFIIMGSYGRTDHTKDPVDRLMDTIDDIGASITITSITSTLAFGLGAMSDIPAVIWLCMYAFPSVILIYFYQLTFFCACIVMDERRIMANRRDCFTCFQVSMEDKEAAQEQAEDRRLDMDNGPVESAADKLMLRYAKFLLKPRVKLAVVCVFFTFSVLCSFSASKMKQKFDITELLPKDSFVTAYLNAEKAYSSRKQTSYDIYFRNVNQSDPEIQQQMRDFIKDIVDGMDSILSMPERFWLDDLEDYVGLANLEDLPFDEQVDRFLSVPLINEFYGGQISRDEDGAIIASRVKVDADGLDLSDVKDQMKALKQQKDITRRQPINKGRSKPAFYTYSSEYRMWEFYASCVRELSTSAIIGVGTVSLVALLLIPHWTAAPIIFPMMCVLYIDMLGVMQWAGVSINAVSFVILAMSVGLLVDFLMHVLLRYYELPGSRNEKMTGTLQTMGSSILLGGITTFLGTCPLALSSSHVFYTVFIAFLALVVLGVSHGLVLLPVILSTIGTEEQVSATHNFPPNALQKDFRKQTAPSSSSSDISEEV